MKPSFNPNSLLIEFRISSPHRHPWMDQFLLGCFHLSVYLQHWRALSVSVDRSAAVQLVHQTRGGGAMLHPPATVGAGLQVSTRTDQQFKVAAPYVYFSFYFWRRQPHFQNIFFADFPDFPKCSFWCSVGLSFTDACRSVPMYNCSCPMPPKIYDVASFCTTFERCIFSKLIIFGIQRKFTICPKFQIF